MSTVEVRDESQHWRVIAIPVPTVGGELSNALAVARREYEAVYGHANVWDDTFEVSATDDKIVIRFEIKQGATKP